MLNASATLDSVDYSDDQLVFGVVVIFFLLKLSTEHEPRDEEVMRSLFFFCIKPNQTKPDHSYLDSLLSLHGNQLVPFYACKAFQGSGKVLLKMSTGTLKSCL